MTAALVARMTAAAQDLLDSLDGALREQAVASFDIPDRRAWTYLPGPRPGLSLADMTQQQRDLALALLDSGCSVGGAQAARAVIELDMIRRQLSAPPGREPDPTDHRYWVRILGEPGGSAPWAWRVNGHHLAVQITVVDDAVAVTPQFFGAEPAMVESGPHQGLRILPDEEDLGRALLGLLSPAQRSVAVVSDAAPADILTRWDPVADAGGVPAGLSYGEMQDDQRAVLRRLVRQYLDRAPIDVAELAWRDAESAGLDTIEFSWAGSDRPRRGHYYAVRGATFLLEYDNTQDNANHIHSVWRDLQHDWGDDLLAQHYARAHR